MISTNGSNMPVEIILQTSERFLNNGIQVVSQYDQFELFQTIQQFKQLKEILEDSLSVGIDHKRPTIFPSLLPTFFRDDVEKQILIGIEKIDQILNACYGEVAKFGVPLQYDKKGIVICHPDSFISYWLDWWEEYASTLTELDWAYFILCRKEQKIPVNLYPEQPFKEYLSNRISKNQKKRKKKLKKE